MLRLSKIRIALIISILTAIAIVVVEPPRAGTTAGHIAFAIAVAGVIYLLGGAIYGVMKLRGGGSIRERFHHHGAFYLIFSIVLAVRVGLGAAGLLGGPV